MEELSVGDFLFSVVGRFRKIKLYLKELSVSDFLP
jgi:hypothetical protein